MEKADRKNRKLRVRFETSIIAKYPRLCEVLDFQCDNMLYRVQSIRLGRENIEEGIIHETALLVKESKKLSSIYIYDADFGDAELEVLFSAILHRINEGTQTIDTVVVSGKRLTCENCPSLYSALEKGKFRTISIYWTSTTLQTSTSLYNICIGNPLIRRASFDHEDVNHEAVRFINSREATVKATMDIMEESNRMRTSQAVDMINSQLQKDATDLIRKRGYPDDAIGRMMVKKVHVDSDDILVKNNIQTSIDSYFQPTDEYEKVTPVHSSEGKSGKQMLISQYFEKQDTNK